MGLWPTEGAEKRKSAATKKKAPAKKTTPAAKTFPAGAAGELGRGVEAYEKKQYAAALTHLKSAGAKLPLLRDYTGAYIAASELALEKYDEAAKGAMAVRALRPASPATARADLVCAAALIKLKRPAEAAKLLREHLSEIAPAPGYTLLGEALEAAGDLTGAAEAYQSVYYGHPLSNEADDAGAALERLRASLGERYPPAMPQAMMARAGALMNARNYGKARQEYALVVQRAVGLERDLARVRISACDYRLRQNAAALRDLRALEVQAPEADAERLYWMSLAARRLDADEDVAAALARLERYHARTNWRAETLFLMANAELLKDRVDNYVPLYRACAEAGPGSKTGSLCHWKVAWDAWLNERPGAGELMRDHLRIFPGSEHANAALYFYGRWSEGRGDRGVAKACYAEIAARFPNSYYAVVARRRLNDHALSGAMATPPAWLAGVAFPERRRTENFHLDARGKLRSERARALHQAAMNESADAEMRYGIEHGEAMPPLVLEMARLEAARGDHGKAVRVLRTYIPGYLWFDVEAVPDEFWRLAFPLPYRASLEKWTHEFGVDMFLMAGLIRQESEFDPKALSPAGAYGLTQIMPSTGRQLARRAGLKNFSTARLYDPETSLHLGTMYVRDLLRQHEGVVEHTLASFNAGKSRTDVWSAKRSYREMSEFIESIPFTETRNYVQIVLRNAETYRRLYGAATLPKHR